MINSALACARAYQSKLVAFRRDIHAHPELGLEEHRTSDLVARKLEEWGITDCIRDMRETGKTIIEATAQAQEQWGEHVNEPELRISRDLLAIEGDGWLAGPEGIGDEAGENMDYDVDRRPMA